MRCEWMATRYDHSTERSTSRNAHHYYDNGKSTDNDAFVYHQTNNRSSSMNNKQRRPDDNSKYRQSRTTHESDRLKEKSNVQTGVRLKEFGDWSEQNSSSGKRYFYNRQTEVSQWDKPKEWRDYERTLLEKSTTARSPSIGSSSATPSWNTPQGAVAATSSTGNNHHGGYSTAAESPHDHRRAPTPNGAVLQYDASTSSHHQSNRGGANLKRDRTNDSPISDLSKRRKTPHYNSYHQPSTSADYDGNVDNRRGDANFGATSRNDTYRLHGGADVTAGSQGHRHDSRIVDQQQEAWKNTASSIDSPPIKVARQSGDNSTVVSASNPTQFAITADGPSCSSAGGASSREPNDVKQQLSCDNELQLPMLPPLSAEHMRYYNGESARHSTGWASEHFDAQANVHSIAAINISLRLGDVSADLKCARSLVRTAEIRSTLLRQKLLFVAQQQRQLAAALSSSKPPSSTI